MTDKQRAVFTAAMDKAGADFEPGEPVEDAAALHAAVDQAIKAEAYERGLDPAKDYQKASRSFFSRNPDVHRAYLACDPPQRTTGGY